jgi:hypothetical protein
MSEVRLPLPTCSQATGYSGFVKDINASLIAHPHEEASHQIAVRFKRGTLFSIDIKQHFPTIMEAFSFEGKVRESPPESVTLNADLSL